MTTSMQASPQSSFRLSPGMVMSLVAKGLVWLLFTLLLLASILSVTVAFLLTDDRPLIIADGAQQVADAETINELWPQVRWILARGGAPQTLTFTRQQLDSLTGFAQRAFPRLSGKVDLMEDRARVMATVELPQNPFGPYINVSVDLLNAEGLQLGPLNAGEFSISGERVLYMLVSFVDWQISDSIASELASRVRGVRVAEDSIKVDVAAIAKLVERLRTLPKNLSTPKEQDRSRKIGEYYSLLEQVKLPRGVSPVSLDVYLKPLFAAAKARAEEEGDPEDENEAAMMALSMYAGSRHFGKLVGVLPSSSGHTARTDRPLVLAKRADLALHFVYSMALKVLSDRGLSNAIGEFKELMDRAATGSGYSFVDLAADKAGIHLADAALDSERAVLVQTRMAASNGEADYMPAIDGLPEGLSKAQFVAQFEQVDSPQYQEMVAEIERRIQALPLHQP
ncbi:hypothetical protein P2G88_19180 [Aliiglaciecola sp. CAU 1673]|uniref:hypothetical protein n=1 Tax=Aliiglaciecola sp. CAU 1673 TaxID=3032595 RepID=UPI0023DC1DF0|nr:hypothetical protein [Aliiglaciecola sp. CAU 1673]MDF2180387.1 hypothetical protein [Aliiglaciecola sp. CAU 1673]